MHTQVCYKFCTDLTMCMYIISLHAVSPSTCESDVKRMIEKARSVDPSDWREITSMIWLVFSDPDALNCSFLLPEPQGVTVVGKPSGKKNEKITVDVESVRRIYDTLLELEVPSINNALANAMPVYCTHLARNKHFFQIEPLNHLVLLLENPQLHSPEFTKASSNLLSSVAALPIVQKEMLARYYSTYSVSRLQEILSNFQQLITMQLLFSEDDHRALPQQDPLIASATKVMMLFYFASLLMSQRSGVVRPMTTCMSSIAANPKPRFLDIIDLECDQLLMRLRVREFTTLHVVWYVNTTCVCTCTQYIYTCTILSASFQHHGACTCMLVSTMFLYSGLCMYVCTYVFRISVNALCVCVCVYSGPPGQHIEARHPVGGVS